MGSIPGKPAAPPPPPSQPISVSTNISSNNSVNVTFGSGHPLVVTDAPVVREESASRPDSLIRFTATNTATNSSSSVLLPGRACVPAAAGT
jgi:hypothetical protein